MTFLECSETAQSIIFVSVFILNAVFWSLFLESIESFFSNLLGGK